MPIKCSPENPVDNRLSEGTSEEGLLRAIRESGYPLQGVVANELCAQFTVVEEWGYFDRETDEHRSLDIYAWRSGIRPAGAKVQSSVVLLVECKRSSQPYVFFKRVAEGPIGHFPPVVGIGKLGSRFDIRNKEGTKWQQVPYREILGLRTCDYVKSNHAVCTVLAKGEVAGNKVRLSGNEPFNKLIRPLVSGLHYAEDLNADSALTVDRSLGVEYRLSLILCIAVVDGPMLLVEGPDLLASPQFVPWVRLLRREAQKSDLFPFRYYVCDVVHASYLETFLESQLIPFAEEFADRVGAMHEVLARGAAEPSELGGFAWLEAGDVLKGS